MQASFFDLEYDAFHGADPLPRHAPTAKNSSIKPVARTRTGPAQTDSSPSDQSQRPSAAWRLHLNQRPNRLARSLDPAKAYQTRATEPAVVAIFNPQAIRINALHHLVSNSSEPAVVAILSPRTIRINALHRLVSNLRAQKRSIPTESTFLRHSC